MSFTKPKVLVFIVAYHAEKTIDDVIRRISPALAQSYDVEILIIDDASRDSTFERSHYLSKAPELPFPVYVLFNPVNQGYGGNQKLGYHYAIKNGFDFVALLHGDGQYAPERLSELLEPLRQGETDAVFGSRMLTRGGALHGGMPLYKFLGNKILSWIENKLLHTGLSEFHSGYRAYSVRALEMIPFERNTNDFHFDTEIIIQLVIACQRIIEVPIPTYYGDEICRVNGLKYAANVVRAVFRAWLQDKSLFYDRRFDCAPAGHSPYSPKLTYASPHKYALEHVRPGSRVLDLGCAGGYMGSALRNTRQCSVTGVDVFPPGDGYLDAFYFHDLSEGPPEVDFTEYDVTLMLDVIEHLPRPEQFLDQLRTKLAMNPEAELIISTANIGFFVNRIMLLLGQFNYGKRGILDLTHTRLFTFASLRRACDQAGFEILETRGMPAPYPLALGENWFSLFLVAVNDVAASIWRGLFAYQICMRVKPRPSLEALLHAAREESRIRVRSLEAAR
ncbi:MAG: glycosyltransferase [Bryobacterales bacterium]|nr:glycosyltransferase [Bryobacterales bacterium]MBV9399341.1 glycosyltransferase [Bryobacterales bacterium]